MANPLGEKHRLSVRSSLKLCAFAPVEASRKNGAFITSCICHGCPWAGDTLAVGSSGPSPYEAYGRWYVGMDVGKDAIHIDARLPNGNGTIKSASCKAFP